MKKIAVFLAATMVAIAAFAGASSVGNSYIVANNAWYDGSGSGHTAFNGYQFGELTALTLGGELTVNTDDYAPGWGDAWGGPYMGYFVREANGSEKIIGDTFINLTKVDGGDNWIKIQNTTGVSVDFTQLTVGKDYAIEVFFGGVDEKWDSGNNYVATFTAAEVPEPATMSLLGLGALALALRRKLRK